jgi:hypothetical protein
MKNESEYAEARHEVFLPKSVKKDEKGKNFVSGRAEIELAFDLQKHGMPSGVVILFMRMLWHAGPGLDHTVGLAGIAQEAGVARQNIQRPLNKLRDAGIVVVAQPETRPARWRFLKYHELVTVVKATWSSDRGNT